MDLVLKNKLGVAYAQDLVIHVRVYGISGYHNNVLLCVCVCLWNENYEISAGALNFITLVKMT